MPSDPVPPLTTLYRLVVMGGTLACGSMAAYRYGPEPAALAATIDWVAGMVMEAPAGPGPPGDGPAEWSAVASLTPLDAPAGAPRFDPAVSPASAVLPLEIPPPTLGSADSVESQRLVAPVLAAGATSAAVEPWGDGLFRATAAVPVGDGFTGLERRLDAVGATPAAAVEAVADSVRDEILR